MTSPAHVTSAETRCLRYVRANGTVDRWPLAVVGITRKMADRLSARGWLRHLVDPDRWYLTDAGKEALKASKW